MKLFECQSCGQLLFFENRRCEKCARQLGYLPEASTLSALEGDGPSWRPLASPAWLYRFCANAAYDACNWLVPIHSPEIYCRACRHNRVIPDLTGPGNLLAWQKLEAAKHRLLYTLLKLNLPLENRIDRPDHGLTFDFLADPPGVSGPKVSTGHHNGVITIALAEADDAERESRRKAMGEPYRTLLGSSTPSWSVTGRPRRSSGIRPSGFSSGFATSTASRGATQPCGTMSGRRARGRRRPSCRCPIRRVMLRSILARRSA